MENINKRILLIEPGYKAKYPPLGLMKISSYHKSKGDEVVFYKGTSAAIRDQVWDKIYITSMFTFAGSIMKCNTWRSRKEPDTLSGYGKTILAFEHR